ncbi:MAG: hypothetical protein K5769_07860 [Pseudobutyrivibrio sp.]|nr:hypothetical protein [Pseudobutyrivibrio sp.]
MQRFLEEHFLVLSLVAHFPALHFAELILEQIPAPLVVEQSPEQLAAERFPVQLAESALAPLEQ